jgi:hypothetical protein
MDGKSHLSDHLEAVDRMTRPDNRDTPPMSPVGGKNKMPHVMHTRLVIGLSTRAISITMKSGDFIYGIRIRDSAVAFVEIPTT